MSKIKSSFTSDASEVARNIEDSAYDNVKLVADNIDDVVVVATAITDGSLQDVMDNIDDITAVGAIAAEVVIVAGISDDVIAVAANEANINTVSADIASVILVAGSIADVITVAASIADVSIVADDIVNVVTVSGSIANVNTVSADIEDVSTVATDIVDVSTVADDIAAVTTIADNMADVTYFADIYQGPKAIDPTLRNDGSALQEGDLYFNTVVDALQVYTGVLWESVDSTQDPVFTGMVTSVAYTDTNDGMLTLADNLAVLHSTPDFSDKAVVYNIAGVVVNTLVDGVTNYVVINYNSGTPQYEVTQDVSIINESDVIPYITIFREGTTLLMLPWDTLANGLANKLNIRLVKTKRFERASGLFMSESGVRELDVTAGSVWYGGAEAVLEAVNSVVDQFCTYYKVAGNWFKDLSYTAYDNTYYNDGTNRVEISNSKYGVVWVYRCICDTKKFCTVLGDGSYNLSEAEETQPPTSLPPAINSQAMLLGRIIVQKGATSATVINSSFDVVFTPSAVSIHNEQAGIQGGIADEYYHFTSDEHTKVQKQLEIAEILDEPNGFNRAVPITMGDIDFVDATRTMSIQPQGGESEFYFFSDGKQVIKTTEQSVQIPDVTGLYLFYFNESNTLVGTIVTTEDIFLKYCLVAFVYWNATAQQSVGFGDERHGIQMDGFTHAYLHNTEGARYFNGMTPDLSNNSDVLGGGGVATGMFYDEDILHSLPQQLTMPIYYLVGTEWTKDTASTILSKEYLSIGRPAYNYNNGGSWEQGDPGNNDFVLMHMFATNDVSEPYVLVQGQDQYGNRGSARTGAETEIHNLYTGEMPVPEFVAICSFILDENREIELTDEGDVFVDWRLSDKTGGSTTPTDHASLINRSAVDQHPITAITGLQTELDVINTASSTMTNGIPQSRLLEGTITLTNTEQRQNYGAYTYTGNGTSQDITTNINSVDLNNKTQVTTAGGIAYKDGMDMKATVHHPTESEDAVITSGECETDLSKVHIKNRSQNDKSNMVVDGLRGVANVIVTDNTFAENTYVDYNPLSFNSDGVSVGSGVGVNGSGDNFVAYQTLYTHLRWGVTDGVKWIKAENPISNEGMRVREGSDSAISLPHDLNEVIEYSETKRLNAVYYGVVYCGDKDRYLRLYSPDGDAAEASYPFWANTSPTKLVFTLAGAYETTNKSGGLYVDYYRAKSETWIIVEYVGTGVAGNYVECGFKPAEIVIKRIDGVGSWVVLDNIRGMSTGNDPAIYFDLSTAEYTGADFLDMESVGLSLNGAFTQTNAAGGTYIALVRADTNADGGGSWGEYPTDTTQLNGVSQVISYSDGYGSNGAVNTIETPTDGNITVSGLAEGINYIKKVEGGGYEATLAEPEFGEASTRDKAGDNPDIYIGGKWYNSTNGDEKVVNGDFNTGDLTGWSSHSGNTTVSSTNKLRCQGDDSIGGTVYSDTFSVVKGKTYHIIVSVSDDDNTTAKSFVAISKPLITEHIEVLLATATPSYGINIFKFTAIASEAVVLTLSSNSINSAYVTYYDNISVFETVVESDTPYPTPITYLDNKYEVTQGEYVEIQEWRVPDITLGKVKVDSLDVNEDVNFGGSINGTGLIGDGQSWQDVTGERASNVTYTNTTEKPLFVSVSGDDNVSVIAYVDNVLVAWSLANASMTQYASFLVPSGSVYEVTVPTLKVWSELR